MGTLNRRIEKLEIEDTEFEAAVVGRIPAAREQCEKLDLFSWLDDTLPVEMSREHAAEELVRWLALADEFDSRLVGKIADPELRRDEAWIRASTRMGSTRAEAEALAVQAEALAVQAAREDAATGSSRRDPKR